MNKETSTMLLVFALVFAILTIVAFSEKIFIEESIPDAGQVDVGAESSVEISKEDLTIIYLNNSFLF